MTNVGVAVRGIVAAVALVGGTACSGGLDKPSNTETDTGNTTTIESDTWWCGESAETSVVMEDPEANCWDV